MNLFDGLTPLCHPGREVPSLSCHRPEDWEGWYGPFTWDGGGKKVKVNKIVNSQIKLSNGKHTITCINHYNIQAAALTPSVQQESLILQSSALDLSFLHVFLSKLLSIQLSISCQCLKWKVYQEWDGGGHMSLWKGLNMKRWCRKRFTDCNLTVLEKRQTGYERHQLNEWKLYFC